MKQLSEVQRGNLTYHPKRRSFRFGLTKTDMTPLWRIPRSVRKTGYALLTQMEFLPVRSAHDNLVNKLRHSSHAICSRRWKDGRILAMATSLLAISATSPSARLISWLRRTASHGFSWKRRKATCGFPTALNTSSGRLVLNTPFRLLLTPTT